MVYKPDPINDDCIKIAIIDDNCDIIKCTNRLITSFIDNEKIELITNNDNADMVRSNQLAFDFILNNLPDIVVIDINLIDGYSADLVKKCLNSEHDNLKRIKWIVFSSDWYDSSVKSIYNNLGITRGVGKTDCVKLLKYIKESIKEIEEERILIS